MFGRRVSADYRLSKINPTANLFPLKTWLQTEPSTEKGSSLLNILVARSPFIDKFHWQNLNLETCWQHLSNLTWNQRYMFYRIKTGMTIIIPRLAPSMGGLHGLRTTLYDRRDFPMLTFCFCVATFQLHLHQIEDSPADTLFQGLCFLSGYY